MQKTSTNTFSLPWKRYNIAKKGQNKKMGKKLT